MLDRFTRNLVPTLAFTPLEINLVSQRTLELQSRLMRNDMQALIAWRLQRMQSPGFEEMLPNMRVPTLLYAGSADPTHAQIEACAKRIPGATFVSLAGLGYIEAMCRAELVLPPVQRFLEGAGGQQNQPFVCAP
jgi:pimeloyl-ACP methyl ester carboxylesterase